MLLLSIAFGVFILGQIMNGILNIWTAKSLKKTALLQDQLKSNDHRMMREYQEDIVLKFSEIMDELIDARDRQEELEGCLFTIEQSLNEICCILAPPEERRVSSRPRGPYGPRKNKALGHKEQDRAE